METNDFLAQHGNASFRHSDELFAAIRAGMCVLEAFSDGEQKLPGSHFLRIYRIRSEMLRDRIRERSVSGPHATAMIADEEALIREFEGCQDEPCGVWVFSLPPHHTFSVYEALRSHRILGCIRGVDRRLVDEQTWEHLWSETDAT